MDCNVIKDLLPLYIDSCCSKESAKLVEDHLRECADCKAELESMKAIPPVGIVSAAPVSKPSRINNWKASVMQSVLFFVSFALITAGVALEAATPLGFTNGLWAFWLVIPTTGFLLSLANWYFVRLYKNRKTFSSCSFLATLGITLCAYIWAGFHYELSVFDFVSSITDVFEMIPFLSFNFGIGIILTAVFCVLSKVLSNKYAAMLGKE